ncbi:chaperone [Sphaerisporangium krabiense]|uniref:Energy-coupling factor transporter ATP-binding protein EcfA2 n=1 Tax=Sphaerisporangium krabiense TaxID=763782 RepID=A0A7W8YZW0_9ACTN|nr:AAA family ATPase [Sphaerisporangium krabiense]MBB5624583.1 energy-coupling factor transporter ATP-binding protein EcfA2 [Sphaerisporangium krabiense]GII61463.1 chaperone [Sphaerisporangium krabiense]
MTRPPGEMPHFVRELCATLPVHAQYILHGNIRDRFLITPAGARSPVLIPIIPTLCEALYAHGYECVIVFDPIDRLLTVPPFGGGPEATRKAAEDLLPSAKWDRRHTLAELEAVLTAVTGRGARRRAAFVMDYASRITGAPAHPQREEQQFFRFAEKLSQTAEPLTGPPGRPGRLFNPVIWLVDGERDLPAGMVMGNERVRSIGVPLPDLELRLRAAALEASLLGLSADDREAGEVVRHYAEQTDGMTLRAMQEVRTLTKDRGADYTGLADAIRVYKFGVENNPWHGDHLRDMIRQGEQEIVHRVMGQEQAVTKTLDILKRAVLGLSGAQATSSATRPRGTLFFAGPTGVGKTELAKAIAALLFGTRSEPLRFDMSEFSAEQAADRLIGAPPGYVGYEAGGELTGAVRRNPFRVILFDEIEKAHPRILDKFLQILEDGRLTDGQGVTTYFSECVLVFTSNLGIMVPDPDAPAGRHKVRNASPEDDYPTLTVKVLEAVKRHFLEELGRPELLNRFGDNIVVFRYIDQDTAGKIFELQLGNIVRRVLDTQHITVTIDGAVRDHLRARCTGPETLENGGRGVGTVLESRFVNPLARALFDGDARAGSAVHVAGIREHAGTVSLELR